jgi:hypothetical protein
MKTLKQKMQDKANEECGFDGKLSNATHIRITDALKLELENRIDWLKQKQLYYTKIKYRTPLHEIFKELLEELEK